MSEPSVQFARLRQVPLFDGLSDEDLERICTDVRDVHLEPGQVLFEEGTEGHEAYVITDGEIEILKATDRREVLLAVRTAGEVVGEMALLQAEPRIAAARARTVVDALAIPKSALDELIETSPSAARAVFQTFITRLRATNDQLRQSERMAQLGVLTAGVAHELNNPAAAVARAADRLDEALGTLAAMLGADADHQLRGRAIALVGAGTAAPTDALTRSDRETEIEDWLEDVGVDEPWLLSADLVDVGVTVADLATLADDAAPDALVDALRVAVATAVVRRHAQEIGSGAGRISTIVRALKSYAYLDRAPVQDVDVRQGLEDTLVLLGHRTRHVRVVREFDDDLPTITALGTELNQVWTNLIDNALDALDGQAEPLPTLTLRARREDDTVVVEVQDNGPGIPEEIRSKVFDPFFTTKPPGKGTGLGLQISYRIVVLEHGGELTVTSRPDRTTFRAVLPTEPPDDLRETKEPDVDDELCEHLTTLEPGPKPDGGVCPSCVALGDTWVHLRFCADCGQVGCCDDSKNRHATRHASETGHPVIRTAEPDEDWAWCHEHRLGVRL